MLKDYKRLEQLSYKLGELSVQILYNKQSTIFVKEYEDTKLELEKLRKKLNLNYE